MKRLVLGVVLAALAMFFWGFLYWGLNPIPYTSWKKSTDDVAAGEALRRYFPESGTYYIPDVRQDSATVARLYEQGPVGFVHLTSREGRPQQDAMMMVRGLLLYLVTAFVLALLMRMALPALPTYGRRVAFAALGGLAAALLIDIGDSVWWYIPIGWKLHQALYDATVWLVGGLVLAAFLRPNGVPGVAPTR